MLDIKMIRQNTDEIKERLATRGVKAEKIDALLEKDKRRRELLVETEGLKQKRNEVSAEIANAKRNKQDATDAIKEMREVGAKIKSLDEELEEVEATVKDMASRLPNLPNPTIPVGPDESANVELRKVGTPREFDFEPKAHWDIGEDLGILDFDRGAKVSGARFVYYKGLGARLFCRWTYHSPSMYGVRSKLNEMLIWYPRYTSTLRMSWLMIIFFASKFALSYRSA